MTWRKRKNWDYIPVEWLHEMPILDEQRNCLFHLKLQRGESVLGRLDLASFEYNKRQIEEVTQETSSAILQPHERTIWFAENGLGPIWRLDPDSGKFTKLAGGAVSETDVARSFGSQSYGTP